MTNDLFRNRLNHMVDQRKALAILAKRMPWDQIEQRLAPKFARKSRQGRKIVGKDLLGTYEYTVGAGVSPAGRPRLPTIIIDDTYGITALSQISIQPQR